MPRVCDKDAPFRDLFVKSWFFMMLWLRLKPAIWLPHPDTSAIEKIRIAFIAEPLAGFGLICNLLFTMAFAANCNFTIVSCFRVDFPKMKWTEECLQILFELEVLFCPFVLFCYKSNCSLSSESAKSSMYSANICFSFPIP